MNGKPDRPWQDIAAQIATETDSERIIALAKELDNTLSVDQHKSKKQYYLLPNDCS